MLVVGVSISAVIAVTAAYFLRSSPGLSVMTNLSRSEQLDHNGYIRRFALSWSTRQ